MQNLPAYVEVVFIVATLLTVWLFYKATRQSSAALGILIIWIALQAVISGTGFYTVTDGLPPRFALLVLPPFLFIIILFITRQGRNFLDRLDQQALTILHVVRVLVELVLYWLFLNKAIPQIMTFEGRNFDIISGLTAPIVWFLGYRKKSLSSTMLLAWNFICLALLVNIVYHAIFSAPFRFQKFAFDQPNIAVLYFPFIWLPSVIVPLVLLSHLAAIRQLLKPKVKT